MGVFAIHNLATGRVRVKTGRKVPGAINRMGFELRLANHRDTLLRAEWNDMGPDRFRVDVLDMVKQRVGPAFDFASELVLPAALYTAELSPGDPA